MNEKAKICCFCGSKELELLYKERNHPYKKDHGPFNLYRCRNCASGLTFPLPSSSELTRLYKSFSGGMIPRIRAIRDKNPLIEWYKQCVDRASQLIPSAATPDFCWMDVGAGNGELALEVLKKFPSSKGVCIDFHDSPANLINPNIRWINIDINNSPIELLGNFDLVFLITVLEHVMYPESLVESLLSQLKPQGVLYITVPDFGSMASMLLKDKWPYFIPGEHLFIPSKKGIKLLLENLCKKKFGVGDFQVKVKSIAIPYTVGYYVEYLKIGSLPKFISKRTVKLPTGMLEASVVLH